MLKIKIVTQEMPDFEYISTKVRTVTQREVEVCNLWYCYKKDESTSFENQAYKIDNIDIKRDEYVVWYEGDLHHVGNPLTNKGTFVTTFDKIPKDFIIQPHDKKL